jgi:hypothetical protein
MATIEALVHHILFDADVGVAEAEQKDDSINPNAKSNP